MPKLLVKTPCGMKGMIHKYDLSMHADQQIPERFTTGDRIDAKVLSFNKNEKLIHLSVKLLEISNEKKIIKEFGSVNSGASLGDILGPAIKEHK